MRSDRLALLALGCIAVGGCTKALPVDGTRQCPSWEATIGPALRSSCGSCHEGASAAAGYDVSTYEGAIGQKLNVGMNQGGDDRKAIAGDAASRILAVLGDGATSPHSGFGELRAQLSDWVLRCELVPREFGVHARGILDPLSPDFHGRLLRSRNYDFGYCKSCHGDDFAGGKAKSSCLSCHAQKPDECATCHGPDGPRSGAHPIHLQLGPLGKALECSECHTVPASYATPGHLLDENGGLRPPGALVTFGATARLPAYPRDPKPTLRNPTYLNGRCSNVYCHQPKPGDGAATDSVPTWQLPADGQRTCSTCHGQPPQNHFGGDCNNCHRTVVSGPGQLLATSLHLDGRVSLGDDSGTCTACHQTESLSGVHTSHLLQPHKLSNPIECLQCHLVPTTVLSPGHLHATPEAEVFPAGGVGPIAGAYNAQPAFDRSTLTCSDVACHGGGDKLTRDVTASVLRSPTWAKPPLGTGPGECGSCHGLPPADGLHDLTWRLQTCVGCHSATIDASGAFKYVDGKTTHANGHVDVP